MTIFGRSREGWTRARSRAVRLTGRVGWVALLAGVLAGCSHHHGAKPGLLASLESDQAQRIRIPSTRSQRPPAVFSLNVPVDGALWLNVSCDPIEDQTVWLQGVLRDPRDPDTRHMLEPGPRGGVLKAPRVDAGVPYTLAVVNLGAQAVSCDVLYEVVPLEALNKDPEPLDVDQVAKGVLFPWPGLAKRRFIVAIPERSRVAVDVQGTTGDAPVAITWEDDSAGGRSARGRLDLEDVPAGTYGMEVSIPLDAPPTPFVVVVNAVPACTPEPVTLYNWRWYPVELAPGGCRSVFLGRIRIDHATPLRLQLTTDFPDRLEVRYRPPDRPWIAVAPRSQELPRVVTFGWHLLEVRLKPRAPGPVQVRLRMTYQRPCATLKGTVFDVRGDTVVVDLHRWQGVRAGMRGYLKRDGRVVGRVEVLGVSSKAAVLRVVESKEPPRVDMEVVFPCQ